MRTLGTLALAVSLCVALPARAATYYVRTDGNAANTGLGNSPLEAFAAVQQAADVVNPGDVVAVQAGQYSETVTLTRSGTSTSQITFRADGDVQGIRFVTNAGAGSWPNYAVLNLYTVIDGFHFVGGGASGSDAGIATSGVTNLTIQNCTFESLGTGVSLRGAIATRDTYVTLRNDTFRNNGTGLGAHATDHVIVEDSTFTNNTTYGIYADWGMSNGRVDRCAFSGNQVGVWLDGTTAFPDHTTVNTRISRSTFVGGGRGVVLGNYAASNSIVNNVFANHWAYAVTLGAGGPATVSNDAFVGNGWAVLDYGGQFTATNNLFWQNTHDLYSKSVDVPPGPGSLAADPMFVDAAAGDYSLLDGSPAIEAGDPAYDADPARRGRHVDIGAVEWNETVRPTSGWNIAGTWGDAGWLLGAYTLQLSATDVGFGVKEIRFSVDGGGEIAAPGAAKDVTVTGDGTHEVVFYAVDWGDNVEAVPHGVSYRIDATKPVTTASAQGTPTNGWYRSDTTVSLAASDATSGVRQIDVREAGGAWATTASAAASIALSTDGRHTVEYRAQDVAGNVEDLRTFAVSIDKTAPTVSVVASPTTLKSTGKPQTVSVTVTTADGTSGVASVTIVAKDASGVIAATASGTNAALQLAGTKGQSYTITATSTDKAGNSASATAPVAVK